MRGGDITKHIVTEELPLCLKRVNERFGCKFDAKMRRNKIRVGWESNEKNVDCDDY